MRHPDFDLGTHENNFAILFLEGVGFEAMPHIAPVRLPLVMRILHSFINERHIVFPQPCAAYNKDENCVANGWGKDKFGADGRYLVTISDRSVKV